MSQNDFTIANQSFPAFRADLNSALQALATNSSGATAPSTTFANMWWYDSANNIMYIRNEDNDAWIKFAELDQTNDKFVLSGTLQLDDGTVSAPALTFNSDTNMGIYRGGTDILKFVTAGTDAITIDASQNVTLAGSLNFGDNDKANFGAGSDLQIYHDGSNSYVDEQGTGSLILRGNAQVQIKGTNDENMAIFDFNGSADLYFDNVKKLATTATGIDVTGTVVSDGLTVAGNVSIDGGTIKLDGNYPVGSNNVALGDTALDSLTTASSNTAIGYLALTSSNADNNTAVGAFAGDVINSGQNNTTVGASSMGATTTGSHNSAFGHASLNANTTGSYNVALGTSALENNTTASNNTAVGYQAGYSNTDSLNLALFGYRAGYNITTGGSNNAFFGTEAGYSNTTAYNNVAVGRRSLYLNSSGLQNVAVGSSALYSNTTASNNTAVGYQALLANTTASNNTAVGLSALLSNTTASNNTAVGYTAGYSNTTGAQNTFVGRQASYNNTTGEYNSSFGNDALFQNTTGNYNTVLGANALNSNTTASNNTAVGVDALLDNTTGSPNTAMGKQAMENNTTGANNVSVGYQSLRNNTTAGNNTSVGYQALSSSTGGNNTAIGDRAGQSITTGSKNTILGRYNGNQGGLDIRTSSNHIVLSDGDGNPRAYFRDSSSNRWNFEAPDNGLYSLIIRPTTSGANPNGLFVYYENTAPDDANGRFITCSDSTATRFQVNNDGDAQNHDNSYGAISDVKLKEQITDASSQWEDIKALTVRKYKFKEDVANKGDSDDLWRLGVVAQEVEEAGMNGLVKNNPDIDPLTNQELSTTTKTVKYSILYMKAVKALQEAMERIETLEQKVATLEGA